MKLAKLTAANGQPVFVNPQHVVGVHQDNAKGKTRVLTAVTRDGLPYFFSVKGEPEQVAQVIEQATKEPSFLDKVTRKGGDV